MRIYRKAPRREKQEPFGAGAADSLHQPSSFITRAMVADVLEVESRSPKERSVCFTGHRHIAAEDRRELSALLDEKLAALYRQGYRYFYCGGALGFDTLAAEAVVRLKETAPEAQLIMALPCPDQSKNWPPADTACYERLLYLADRIQVTSSFYFDGCMQVRNRFMVDHSALCVCYLVYMRGGTMSTVKYALDQGCRLVNLAMLK